MLHTYNGKLRNLKKESEFLSAIVSSIKNDFGVNLPGLRNNIELVNTIANNIEDHVKYSLGKKCDKLALFHKIYSEIFANVGDNEKENVTTLVEYLHENGKIKARPFLKYVLDVVRGFFQKKENEK